MLNFLGDKVLGLSKVFLKSSLQAVLLLLSGHVLAKSETLGAVYPINEPDALEEILANAEKMQDNPLMNKPQKDWSALNPYTLPVAERNRIRAHIPWYTGKRPT